MDRGGPCRLQIPPRKVAVHNDVPAVQVAGSMSPGPGAVAVATAS